ncbi:MAG: CYCXC family (seleno)protein [Nitrospinota bacterium]
MAKKKSKSKNKNTTTATTKSNKLPVIAAVVIALMTGGYLITQSAGMKSGTVSTEAGYGGSTVPITAGLIETKPTMAPNRFKGAVSTVYKWAAEIPEVFDKMYCYCRCKENPRFKHKTLLTCYTDTHAAKCGICLKEGQMAWELTKRGMQPKEIRGEIDKYYAKLQRSRF